LSCAHDQCIDLVNLAIEKGSAPVSLSTEYRFLINSPFHLSECRKPREVVGRSSQMTASRLDAIQELSGDVRDATSTGKYASCVHVSFTTGSPATDLVQDITRSHTSFSVPIVEVGEASLGELRILFRDPGIWKWKMVRSYYAEASGHCAGYFIERAAAVRSLSRIMKDGNRPAETRASSSFIFLLSHRQNKELTVTQIRAEIAMRFSNIRRAPPVVSDDAPRPLLRDRVF
jgi:hypothetical protein